VGTVNVAGPLTAVGPITAPLVNGRP